MSEVGKSTFYSQGAWTVRGVQDWNHATEQLMEHSQSKWHRDVVNYARTAEQGDKQSVQQLQCTAAVKEAEERRANNETMYFLANKCLPLTTTSY